MTYFFLHVPKTGGTSLREAAIRHFGEQKVLLIYGRDSRTTSAGVKGFFWSEEKFAERLKKLSDYIVANGILLVSSHQPSVGRLQCFDAARAFTLLRDPVERVISNYEFNVRKQDLTGVTLADYIEQEPNRNMQSRTLRNIELSRLGAVGITEEYDGFLAYLALVFGFQLARLEKQRQSLIGKARRKLIAPDVRRRIELLNEDDMQLYAEARSIWEDKAKALR